MKQISAYLKSLEEKPALKWHWLFLLLAILFIPNIFISFNWMQQSLMPDLHIRIVGSRWMEEGMSPYFSQWKPGNGVRMYNPNMFMSNGVNAVTVTPTVLWLQLPFSRMNYCDIKFTWWIAMEVLLFGTLYFTCLIPTKLLPQLLTALIGAVFFCYSRNWWVHVYKGQYYVVFAFLFSASTYMALKQKKQSFPLFFFPLFALLRPFFALATLPWLLGFNRKRWLILFAGALVSITFLLSTTPLKTLKDYSGAMKFYSTDITGSNTKATAVDYRREGLPTEACIYKITEQEEFGAGSLFSVQHYLNLFNIKLNNPLVYSAFLLAFTLLLMITLKRALSGSDAENLLLSSFIIYMLSELFTPAIRNPYNMVQYLGIVGVFMSKANYKLMLLMILGLLLNHDFPFRFKYQREAGEAIMIMALYFSILVNNRRSRAK